MELFQSKTFENLNAAFTAEARLTMLYRLWAHRAQLDGRHATAQIFEQTALNETSHARLWYGLLHPDAPDTFANLDEAARLEHDEWSQSYTTFARVARQEGFDDIARQFDLVAGIESQHEQIFARQAASLRDGSAIHQCGAEWICQQCGYHWTGDDAPATCPVCGKGSDYFTASGK